MMRSAAFVLLVLGAACNRGPKKTCRVNDQCFTCPNDEAIAKCKADPTRSRCKWAPMSECE